MSTSPADYLGALAGIVQFTTWIYLVLLALAVISYFALPGVRTRTAWLLFLSLGFYGLIEPKRTAVLLVMTGIAYGAGLLIGRGDRADDDPDATLTLRQAALGGTVVLLVAGLALFKYAAQLSAGGVALLGGFGDGMAAILSALIMPVGMSFWTFQTIAYVVDVYRGDTKPERNPFLFLLAVSFFPVVTSGPITKVQALTEQLRVRHRFDYAQMNSGLLLIGRGFFKKLIVADRLAPFVNSVYSSPRSHSASTDGLLLFVASVFFAIQLYMDFSGYTDIVRGSARLFGVELPINFRAPYFARSVRDFWRRWHITLMNWLRDYVYIPLGGSRVGSARRYFNLLVVFAVSGLWHGTGWQYLAWGLLNGFYMVAGGLLEPVNTKVTSILRIDRDSLAHRVFQTTLTFTLVTIAWVFFRAQTLGDALYIVARMFSPTLWIFNNGTLLKQGLGATEIAIAVIGTAVVFLAEWLSLRHDMLGAVRRQPLLYRWALYYALIFVVLVFGAYGGAYNAANFLYFKY